MDLLKILSLELELKSILSSFKLTTQKMLGTQVMWKKSKEKLKEETLLIIVQLLSLETDGLLKETLSKNLLLEVKFIYLLEKKS